MAAAQVVEAAAETALLEVAAVTELLGGALFGTAARPSHRWTMMLPMVVMALMALLVWLVTAAATSVVTAAASVVTATAASAEAFAGGVPVVKALLVGAAEALRSRRGTERTAMKVVVVVVVGEQVPDGVGPTASSGD